MGTTDTFDVLPLFRQAARKLLEIPEEATEADVRRRCLDRLEEDDFDPSDDASAAIQLLCGESLRAGAMPRHAPELGRHVEFLIRKRLEPIAVRLRQRLNAPDSPQQEGERKDSREADLPIQAALDIFRGAAELFPSTELWHRQLAALSEMDFPRTFADHDQAQIAAALLESATTWPGQARQVRRTHLAVMVPRVRFAGAARALRKERPAVAALDPLLVTALAGPAPETLPGPSLRPAARKLGAEVRRNPLLWTTLFAVVFVGIVVLGASSSRPPTSKPKSDPIPRPASTETAFVSKAVYAPQRLPTVPGFAPGEAVSMLFATDEKPVLSRDGKHYRVPKKDFLPLFSAISDLEKRTKRSPNDGLAWIARGNIALQRGEETMANECYEAAVRLGFDWTVKTVDGKPLRIPVVKPPRSPAAEPDVPPPPPLPTTIEREVR